MSPRGNEAKLLRSKEHRCQSTRLPFIGIVRTLRSRQRSTPAIIVWKFEGGSEVHASAAPQYLGNESLVDPEQAFVAALSSCHMLTFLALAARDGFVVEDYRDEAVGMMERNEQKRIAITRVVLRPAITWGGELPISRSSTSSMRTRTSTASSRTR